MAHTFSVCTPTPKVQVCYNIDSNANKYVSLDANIGNISYNYVSPMNPAMAGHTLSVCTPTLIPFVQRCANMDNSGNAYLSTNVNIGSLSYSYIPDQCTTTHYSDKIVTKCPDTTTTIYFTSPNDMTMQNIQEKLDLIDKLLMNVKKETNQCTKKLDHITGISAGDTLPSAGEDISTQRFDPIAITNMITNATIETLNLVNDNAKNPNPNEIKCISCGTVWIKNYLLEKKLYWCQMCSIGHVFTPHTITDFAPFNNIDELKQLNEEIKNQHLEIYNNHKGFWRN